MGISPSGLHQVSALCGMKWLRKSIRCQSSHPHTHTSWIFLKPYGIRVRCDLATLVAVDKNVAISKRMSAEDSYSFHIQWIPYEFFTLLLILTAASTYNCILFSTNFVTMYHILTIVIV